MESAREKSVPQCFLVDAHIVRTALRDQNVSEMDPTGQAVFGISGEFAPVKSQNALAQESEPTQRNDRKLETISRK